MWLSDIFNIRNIKVENELLRKKLQDASEFEEENRILKKRLQDLGFDEYEQTKQKIQEMELQASQRIQEMELQTNQKIQEMKSQAEKELLKISQELNESNYIIARNNSNVLYLQKEIDKLNKTHDKLLKQVKTQTNKLSRLKELYSSIDYAVNTFSTNDNITLLSSSDMSEYNELVPSIILKLHCMDMKDLRKAYRENDKQITSILESYSSRYTTKANKAIYSLMVIALRAELQNILYNLKYEKLDVSIEKVKSISAKYLKIAGEGNQNISGTLTKFIGEIEYLFINAVKIEYNYYVKKEQARQEQLALKEQMRQEAEERKALEAERKRVEQEESKYTSEINKLQSQLQDASNSEIEQLNSRILELQMQLSNVVLEKKEITKLQNGKAGNVYIISNLGSFGENIFKIGMTRRLNPQERIDELGSASVPFRFDVHSFIFSNDAVAMESHLHELLNDKRVNKVNLRKEFFYSTLDELETLVNTIDPSAEFNKTMLAEEFRQSQSSNEIYTSDYELIDVIEDE